MVLKRALAEIKKAYELDVRASRDEARTEMKERYERT